MKSLFPFFFLLHLSFVSSAIETINFDIFLFGNKVGYMHITRDVNRDGSEVYALDTKTKAKILWINRENHTHYDVVYKDNKLVSSKVTEIENGQMKRWTNVIREGERYRIDSYKGKSGFTEAPVFSIVTVFFKNIVPVKRIFYEPEGDFNELKKTDEDETWEFKSSDGNRNVFHFKNGSIQASEFHVSIATVKMIRVN